MAELGRDYLAQTTAHGFNRLMNGPDKGNGGRFRKLWVVIIAVAFFTAAYLIMSSVQEVERNPIATDIEYVPVQNILFPSVTLQADEVLGSAHSVLRQAILGQLTYDCSGYTELTPDSLDCLERSKYARSIVHPLVKSLIHTMFKRYLAMVAADQTKVADHPIRNQICSYYGPLKDEDLKQLVNPMIQWLSVSNSKIRKQRVEMFLKLLVEVHKTPAPYFIGKMKVLVDNIPSNKVTEFQCTSTYFDRSISKEAKAMTLLVTKMSSDHSVISVGTWDRTKGNDQLEFVSNAKEELSENFADLDAQVDKIVEKTLQESTIYDDSAMNNIDHDDLIQEQYRSHLRRSKYLIQPLRNKMVEKSRRDDVQQESLNSTVGMNDPESFANFFPAMLSCSFGNGHNNTVCGTPVTSFTSSGIGYAFNSNSFFEMYRENPMLDIFCQEIVETIDGMMCIVRDSKGKRTMLPIKANGPGHSLKLLLHTPSVDKHDWIHQKLAIHSPFSIADMSGNVIDPQPGTHSIVVITPHVTKTDDSLLKEDRSKRGCHHQEVDGNPLKLFANYTKDNCIFECRLQKSIDECGCVPWNYPKLDKETKTCSHSEAYCFQTAMQETDKMESCSHCIDACWRVDYEFAVHTKPLDNVCQKSVIDKNAVNMVVNTKDVTDNLLPTYEYLHDVGFNYHLEQGCFTHARKNTALVEFFVGPATVVEITRRLRVTNVEQAADIGGVVSLLTGASFITVSEAIMYMLEALERFFEEMQRLFLELLKMILRILEGMLQLICRSGHTLFKTICGMLEQVFHLAQRLNITLFEMILGMLGTMHRLAGRLKRRILEAYRARRRGRGDRVNRRINPA